MDRQGIQRKIDAIQWYHEFNFGGGLRAKPSVENLRRIWEFTERHLDPIDFAGKTVLDVGCWDGYWSFYAEKQGAKSVLATDDISQGPANCEGLLLARQLLGSAVEIDPNRSVYELSSLNTKFDVILFFGVYYHLYAPFHAFAQIRHCCHPGTVVLLEGAVAHNLGRNHAKYRFDNHACEFLPSVETLQDMLQASYFRPGNCEFLKDASRQDRQSQTWWQRVESRVRQLRYRWKLTIKDVADRVFVACTPFEGVNEMHLYRPPFGLAAYDDRFRSQVQRNAA